MITEDFSEIFREMGETVTVMRPSVDKDEELIIDNEIVCIINSVDGQHDLWKANLEQGNRDIRKGDILTRDDGSELEVLRNDTQRDFDGEDITELDLKDYDRAEQSFQIDVADVLTDDLLPKRLLHRVVSQKVLPIFMQGSYGLAVFEAFKQVEVAVREAGGYNEKDIGVKLMGKAFNEDTGNLTDQNQHPDEQNARLLLFRGAIGSYKNPGSHRDVEITAEEAAGLIVFASHLLRIVDSRNQSNGDWQEQFANRFVRHLNNSGSPLMDPEVFMGEDDRGYPRYIGFNIGKIEDLDIRDRDAFWLVASTIHDGKIYLKLQMNDSNCFNQLQSQKEEIEREFGGPLKWESRGLRIGVDLSVKPLDENRGQWNQHFEDMREKLEKLNEIFQSRIEDAFSDDDIPFVSDDDIPF